MIVNLRDYEKRAVHDVPHLLAKHRRVVLVGPTGSGKTVAAAHALVTKPLRNSRVLWVAHRKELLDQARCALLDAGVSANEIRMFTGTEKSGRGNARITLASVQILSAKHLPKFDVVVVDEAHRVLAKSYRAIVNARPLALTLGLTATPWRLDGRGLGHVFAHLYVMAITSELIAHGHVAAPRTYGVPYEKARAMIRGVKTRGGDFEEAALSRVMRKRMLMGDAVREAKRLAPRAATVVYAVDRKHGKALAKRFAASGRRTAYLDGFTPRDERSRILAKLAGGSLEVVVSIDVITEGLDVARIKCVVMCRPTKSLTVFLQQIGRASRPWRGKRPVILDHAGNVYRHQLPESERTWSLDDRLRTKAHLTHEGDNVRHCAHCDTINTQDAETCAVCGHDLGPTNKRMRLAEHQEATLERLRATEAEEAIFENAVRAAAKTYGQGEPWIRKVLAIRGVP